MGIFQAAATIASAVHDSSGPMKAMIFCSRICVINLQFKINVLVKSSGKYRRRNYLIGNVRSAVVPRPTSTATYFSVRFGSNIVLLFTYSTAMGSAPRITWSVKRILRSQNRKGQSFRESFTFLSNNTIDANQESKSTMTNGSNDLIPLNVRIRPEIQLQYLTYFHCGFGRRLSSIAWKLGKPKTFLSSPGHSPQPADCRRCSQKSNTFSTFYSVAVQNWDFPNNFTWVELHQTCFSLLKACFDWCDMLDA